MDNKVDHIDDLIGKYLAGEASPEDTAWLEAWISREEANQRYFEQFQTIFARAATVKEWQQFDTDAAWTKLRSTLKTPAKTVPLTPPASNRAAWGIVWRIAASIIIVLGIGIFVYTLNQPAEVNSKEVIAGKGIVKDTLPDGSDVFLNKETKVAYAYDKKSKVHEVALKGEAYFNIHHNGDEKFIIDATGVFIRDIGTSFNVRAYPESNTVEVMVEEGEVVLYTAENPGIYLHAGGKGVYNKKTKTFTVEDPEPNILSYKTKFFTFSGQELGTIVTTLNKVYDKKIVIDNNLKTCPLTVSFNDESIQEIAHVIAETLDLTITETDRQIVLTGNGCK